MEIVLNSRFNLKWLDVNLFKDLPYPRGYISIHQPRNIKFRKLK